MKVILHGTIRNDDFLRNEATMLQRYVALKIVVANRLVQHHLYSIQRNSSS